VFLVSKISIPRLCGSCATLRCQISGRSNVLLHFEAVDYEATVFMNNVKVGHNVGGYFRFTVDITRNLSRGQDNKFLWNVHQVIDQMNQTYEIKADLKSYNYRASRYACSGGVWAQTTDVEGEVNGLYTYDRRVLRPNIDQWKRDIDVLYKAAQKRGGFRG
ncbi:hypothetical protein E4U49_006892, partial [Claviceps purpurea]